MVNCNPDQIRNPKTGRCVTRKSSRKISRKDCNPDQIRNPKTGRCVSKTGKIGKEILGRKSSRKSSRKST
jgi:hypothetical protein